MHDLICAGCGSRWHSAASADVANERGGCLHCGGSLRGPSELGSPAPVAVLRTAEEPAMWQGED